MTANDPAAELDSRYSDPDAKPAEWVRARTVLMEAPTYWLSTVRPDARPHVTPLLAVWMDDALHFCTGPDERKARNLEVNTACVLTTGCNGYAEGFDVIVEGAAVAVLDSPTLRRLADAYEVKYGSDWRFEVVESGFRHDAGTALVFRVEPSTVFAFGKGTFSQTRWRF
ncbi:pyridoxamine 5'-phosphate oxidase family protein [Rhodococcus sp. NPDC058514]|uniref:pyridoxamine 5'-phosphate oxidase family protein n=1 Tax=unclassified Rhodococcus (in: high G+C Gram-positive bacteria) TaxID=192944 RepID=UPI003669D00B